MRTRLNVTLYVHCLLCLTGFNGATCRLPTWPSGYVAAHLTAELASSIQLPGYELNNPGTVWSGSRHGQQIFSSSMSRLVAGPTKRFLKGQRSKADRNWSSPLTVTYSQDKNECTFYTECPPLCETSWQLDVTRAYSELQSEPDRKCT